MVEEGCFDSDIILKTVAREFGYKDKEIDDAMRKHSFKVAGDLVDHLCITLEKRSKDPLQKIRELTKRISREKRCLRCKKKARDTVFLPCGDFVLCHCCAAKVKKCPYCDENIIDSVRAVLTDVREQAEVPSPVDDHQDLLKETSGLYRERMCRYCKNEERDVVFLPCSHLASCRQCASRVENCICGEKIRDAVITFMS